jgi:hypothetical protein
VPFKTWLLDHTFGASQERTKAGQIGIEKVLEIGQDNRLGEGISDVCETGQAGEERK